MRFDDVYFNVLFTQVIQTPDISWKYPSNPLIPLICPEGVAPNIHPLLMLKDLRNAETPEYHAVSPH